MFAEPKGYQQALINQYNKYKQFNKLNKENNNV